MVRGDIGPDDGTWRAEVVLDRCRDSQDPVLGWIVIEHMISSIILLPLNQKSFWHSSWSHYYGRNQICTAFNIKSGKQLAACNLTVSQVKR
jgi:hypothetical protein